MKYITKKFTLIEMLAVIAIIAVLIALIMPMVTNVRNRANKTKAKSEMHSIITAVKSYEMTYGVLPIPDGCTGNGKVDTGNAEYPNLLTLLTNVSTSGADVSGNGRGIRFLDVPDGYTDNGFKDPWGNDYTVYLDTDYNGEIRNAPGGETLYGTVFVTTKYGGPEGETIYSWK
ncbi:MAG: prepilin-type N-terminal cleavage/methylation domain-containing protein [Victivallales bacterium]|nr:prepilin-type N-terminal cleavage/methylation domain-containing protein [Victivallales bacterium]